MDRQAKRKYSRQPTLKQIKALQYINQGMTKNKAMIKAGYSTTMASHPGRVLMKSEGVKKIYDTVALRLIEEGLDVPYMMGKFKEWLEATKSTHSFTEPDKQVPDYKVQLDAYKEWKKIMDQHDGEQNAATGQLKRTMTINEFVTGKEERTVIDNESE